MKFPDKQKNPHAKNPHAKNPHAKIPHPKNPHAKNPHPKNPHAKNPHAKNPHAKNPHAKNTPNWPQSNCMVPCTGGGKGSKCLKTVKLINFSADFSWNGKKCIVQHRPYVPKCGDAREGRPWYRLYGGTIKLVCQFGAYNL